MDLTVSLAGVWERERDENGAEKASKHDATQTTRRDNNNNKKKRNRVARRARKEGANHTPHHPRFGCRESSCNVKSAGCRTTGAPRFITISQRLRDTVQGGWPGRKLATSARFMSLFDEDPSCSPLLIAVRRGEHGGSARSCVVSVLRRCVFGVSSSEWAPRGRCGSQGGGSRGASGYRAASPTQCPKDKDPRDRFIRGGIAGLFCCRARGAPP